MIKIFRMLRGKLQRLDIWTLPIYGLVVLFFVIPLTLIAAGAHMAFYHPDGSQFHAQIIWGVVMVIVGGLILMLMVRVLFHRKHNGGRV